MRNKSPISIRTLLSPSCGEFVHWAAIKQSANVLSSSIAPDELYNPQPNSLFSYNSSSRSVSTGLLPQPRPILLQATPLKSMR